MNYSSLIQEPVEKSRYETLLSTLSQWRGIIEGKSVLDFGASSALSALALIENGAAHITGVEPDPVRVRLGKETLAKAGTNGQVSLEQIPYSPGLRFDGSSFNLVLANAVFEHIPQPRAAYLRELWRVLKPGGHLFINETPNKYLPWDFHTTGGLMFVPWMPREVARRYAMWRGRWQEGRDWNSSGWRGAGYYEIASALGPHRLIPEMTCARHRILNSLGLPSNLFDPYPTLVFQKL